MTVRRALWLAFTLFVLYAGTIPFHFSADNVGDRVRHLSLNPFVSTDTGRRMSAPDFVQNVLLFLPFGALGFLCLERLRIVRRLALVTALGVGLSVTVESLQLLTTDRVSGLNDVLSNGIGAWLGALLAWQSGSLFAAALRRLRMEGLADVDELRPMASAAAALAVAAWQPFDVTLEVGTVISKVRALQTDAWQFTGLRDEGLLVLIAALFSATLSEYLAALGEQRPGRKAAIMGIVLAFGLEASQVLIGSRMPSLWDALVSTSGVALGAAAWTVWRRTEAPGFWLGAVIAATAGAVAMLTLSPFVVAAAYRPFGWFPFLGYYIRTTFDTLSHVFELALVYFPLGLSVAWLKPGSHARTAVVWAAAIAVAMELTQGWIVSRYPDITDVAISLGGAWLGFHAYNRRRA
ncbi:MAG TPA: VanZ family protein [Vicinamibacterales bacterium]|nr:VanZ family protein [Vicinamibacterales bacterium]